ncbi:MAG: hypothetical protein HOU59_gp48 (endogenous virus) [Lactobacillus phage ViSo-2018a]|uniref:Uncharacterized protein n=2 Tax=Lidleunavirus TaxID=2733161 RepID=A0A0A7DMV9_9CAUD|nr:hypothetical protein VC66_gp38 [Lactobacillus phage Ldl1]YP_009816298.1 MAG: hypothetical protein HOU59_gp48 [Lactobacillus phage ViSo-2018a]AIS73896.1 hypothetical protein LDL_038 [Lactobacillus phage Ldl1]AZA17342.1 MAG: hypothetical protein DQL93_0815 [Lactobacillus phage ViSo-2018a]
MLKFFANNKPNLEEFVQTYKQLMLDDLKKIEQEEDFSQEEKEVIKSERALSFEILDQLLESAKEN